jgi:hypothetical protein
MYREYAALCSELKQLYVCVTRPKKRLIIYDQDSDTGNENRDEILKFWIHVGAVEVVSETMIKQAMVNKEAMSEEERQIFAKIAEGQPHLNVLHNEQEAAEEREKKKKGWKLQGITMFKRRFYEQAIKCFSNAGEEELKKRAEAYSFAEKGSKLMGEADSMSNRLTEFS